jgi:hypothetical protein
MAQDGEEVDQERARYSGTVEIVICILDQCDIGIRSLLDFDPVSDTQDDGARRP